MNRKYIFIALLIGSSFTLVMSSSKNEDPLVEIILQKRSLEKLFKLIMISEYDIETTIPTFYCFMEWAFGEEWQGLLMQEMPRKWNEKHGNLFEFEIGDEVFDDPMGIGEIFLPIIKAWIDERSSN